jgi:hypothetical protein
MIAETGARREEIPNLLAEIAAQHSSVIHSSRNDRIMQLLSDAENWTKNLRQDLIKSESELQVLHAISHEADSRLEQVSRFLSSNLTDLYRHYNCVIEQVSHEFERVLESTIYSSQQQMIALESKSRCNEGRLESLHRAICHDTASTIASLDDRHLSMTREIQIQHDDRMKITNREFKEARDEAEYRGESLSRDLRAIEEPFQKSHDKLSEKHTEVTNLNLRNRIALRKLCRQSSLLETEISAISAQTKDNTRKHDVELIIKNLRTQIQRQSHKHTIRLTNLAVKSHQRKDELERRISLIDRIERIWRECNKYEALPLAADGTASFIETLRCHVGKAHYSNELLKLRVIEARRELTHM